METSIQLTNGEFGGDVKTYIVSGPDIKAENTFETPTNVQIKEKRITARNHALNFTSEPHSVAALVCDIS
jgi:alpha-L-arabinofuranosidase